MKETNLVGNIISCSKGFYRVLKHESYPTPMFLVSDTDGNVMSMLQIVDSSEISDEKYFYPGDKISIYSPVMGGIRDDVTVLDFNSYKQTGCYLYNRNLFDFDASHVLSISEINCLKHKVDVMKEGNTQLGLDEFDGKIILVYQCTDGDLEWVTDEEQIPNADFMDAYLNEPEVLVADSMEEVNQRIQEEINTYNIVFGLVDKKPFIVYRSVSVHSEIPLDVT